MPTAQTSSNPFALMMEPEAVFAALASSDRLNRLASRICRPLDKPLPGRPGEAEKIRDEQNLNGSDASDRHDD